MITRIGSRISIGLGTDSSKYFRIVPSNLLISIEVVALETPPTSRTKLRIASGGTPRRRNAIRVYNLGSSQPRTWPSSTSCFNFLFDRIVPLMFNRPNLLVISLYNIHFMADSNSLPLHWFVNAKLVAEPFIRHLDSSNSVVHNEWEICSKLSHKQCVKS
jgi:hypothetical protein